MSKKVLFLALNWGLGHTTRIIPLIDECLKQGGQVVFGGGKIQQQLLSDHFPGLKCLDFPSLNVSLSQSQSQSFSLLLQLPKFLRQISRERKYLRMIVRRERIDLVIADNVYGAYHSKIPSFILSHQIQLELPGNLGFLKKWVNKYNRFLLGRHTQIWIPDFEHTSNLSGKLSHPAKSPLNAKYIGPISRFRLLNSVGQYLPNRVLAILSGPEPQRTIFEEILLEQAVKLEGEIDFVLVRGLPANNEVKGEKLFNHLSTEALAAEIQKAEVVICRSGYSTIMDLYFLKRTAFLVPTPGQSEQEYLANHLAKRKHFHACYQINFELANAIKIMRQFQYSDFEEQRHEEYSLAPVFRKLLT